MAVFEVWEGDELGLGLDLDYEASGLCLLVCGQRRCRPMEPRASRGWQQADRGSPTSLMHPGTPFFTLVLSFLWAYGVSLALLLSCCPQEEEGEPSEGWSSSCLAKFSRCLGMLTEDFEEKILYLLGRMKARIDQRGQEGAKRRANSLSSRFGREVKKLEWAVTYNG